MLAAPEYDQIVLDEVIVEQRGRRRGLVLLQLVLGGAPVLKPECVAGVQVPREHGVWHLGHVLLRAPAQRLNDRGCVRRVGLRAGGRPGNT